jgi:hypothetical protein
MQQATYRNRDNRPLGRLAQNAPTEAEAFLRRGAMLTREDEK